MSTKVGGHRYRVEASTELLDMAKSGEEDDKNRIIILSNMSYFRKGVGSITRRGTGRPPIIAEDSEKVLRYEPTNICQVVRLFGSMIDDVGIRRESIRGGAIATIERKRAGHSRSQDVISSISNDTDNYRRLYRHTTRCPVAKTKGRKGGTSNCWVSTKLSTNFLRIRHPHQVTVRRERGTIPTRLNASMRASAVTLYFTGQFFKGRTLPLPNLEETTASGKSSGRTEGVRLVRGTEDFGCHATTATPSRAAKAYAY